MKTYKYRVWSLDVWGHASNECEGYSCSCIVDCEECSGTNPECDVCDDNGKVHNDNDCDAEFTVNDRCSVGTIEIEAEDAPSDEDLLRVLIEDGFLKETVRLADIEFDDNGMGEDIYINDAKNGRPVFQLEWQCETTCDGSCEPMCAWCNKQADQAAQNRVE